MSERLSKKDVGIIRNRIADYMKIKGRKTMTKKRFSKASLKKMGT